MRLLLIISFLCASIFQAYSQLTVNFNSQPIVCKEEQVQLSNNSTVGAQFEWDFCANDSEKIISNNDVFTLTGLSSGYGYKIVSDGNHWFGFAVSQSNNSIVRLDFGNSPLNTPVIFNLGNPSGLMSFPNGIEIYNHNGNWYGFVGLYDPNSGIVRLNFGPSLTNTPTAQNLGMFGLSGRFWGARVVEENGDLILAIINRNTNSIVRVNYRDSFDNLIDNATHVFSNSISGTNLTPGFDLVKDGTTWVGIVASDQTSALIQIRFKNGILNPPTFESSYATNINRPLQVKLLKEGAHYMVAVTSEFSMLKLIDYKDLNPVNAPSEIVHGNLPSLLATDVIRYKGETILQGVGATNKVRQIIFHSSCGASIEYSENAEPEGVYYTTQGTKNIELKANNGAETSTYGQSISVSSATSPDIAFTSGGVCFNSNISFLSESMADDLINYSWSFGDSQTSTDSNPTHQYVSAGDYTVSLQVTAENGCNNYVEKTISIYDEPIPDFQIPVTNPLCTNQNYVFENTSTTDPGYPVTWQWKVNGVDQTATEDLNYTFTQADNQSVTLTASIPGCENTITKPISTLTEGPLVDFSVPTVRCEDDVLQFTNATQGSVSGYMWNFGDGNSSTDVNTSHVYAAPGSYPLTLTATNAAGCVNFNAKNIQVYSKPVVDFTTVNPCNDQPTLFNDNTTPPIDSNKDSWEWNFGDNSGTSDSQNTQYVFTEAADYSVSLTVTTSAECSNTAEKVVTVKPTPVPDFTNTPACVGKEITFTGTSTGTITYWDWQAGGSSSGGPSLQEIKRTIGTSGSYPVTLTVTGANGCYGQIVKQLVIPVLSPNFSVLKNCINQQTEFIDITNDVADPIVSYLWETPGDIVSIINPGIFSFPSTGSRNIKLSVTTETGCLYSVTKPVTILSGPEANFTVSSDIGGPPLEVAFTNTSNNATSFYWEFNDAAQTTSTAGSPTFTYTELGEYEAVLTAFSPQQCISTTSKIITVVIPVIDVMLANLDLQQLAGGSIKPKVTIINHGNIPLNNVALLLNMNETTIREFVNTSIPAGGSIEHTVRFELPSSQGLDYFCAEAEVEDISILDNKVCLNLESNLTSLSPYPNPATDIISVEWISNDESNVTVTLVNAMGREVKKFEVQSQLGFNPLVIDTEGMSSGIYLVRIQHKGLSKVYRVVVQK